MSWTSIASSGCLRWAASTSPPATQGNAARDFRAALALWRGPALADLRFEPFAVAEADRLEELRLHALEYRIEADLALGAGSELIPELEALVREHPFRERPLGLLMLALYRAGRQAEALAAYQAGRRRLAEELGLEPGPELRELQRKILEHDPSLAPPRGAGVHRPPRRAPRRLVTTIAVVAVAAAAAIVVIGIAIGSGGSKSSARSAGRQPAGGSELRWGASAATSRSRTRPLQRSLLMARCGSPRPAPASSPE